MNRSIVLIGSLLVAAPAVAQWPGTPSKPSQPAPSQPAAPSPASTRRAPPQDDDSSGFSLGVRSGWAFPFGDVNYLAGLGDQVAGQLPVWLEAGWRLNKNFSVGLYGQYAFGFPNNCPPGNSCSTNGSRVGLEAIYNLLPDGVLQPWGGLQLGYEWLSTSRAGEDLSYRGWELLGVQVGVDWALTRQFSIGPFGSASLFGKYTTQKANGVSNDVSASHNWIQTGLRATIKL